MKKEFHEIANIFPMMSDSEFAELTRDIAENGLIEPIWLWDGKIIDGRNRYKACVESGITPEYRDYEGDNPVGFVVSLNLKRRHLNESQRAMVAAKIANMTREDTLMRGSRPANLPIEKVSQTEAATMLNVGDRSIRSAKKVMTNGTPELEKAVESGKVAVSTAAVISELPKAEQKEVVAKGEKEILQKAKEIQAEKREKKRTEVIAKLESVETKEAKALQGVFDVIVIDPPWPMQKIDRDVAPNQTGFDYPVMTVEQIKDVKIPAADNCHMWLWTTHKFLPDALEILKVWGFKYVCTFVWHKNGGFQPFGLPQYNCEFALYARKGSPVFIDTKALNTCFNADRTKHSEKPEIFYDMVRRVTAGRRADMFNRRAIDGFETWGKEAE